MKLKYTNQLKPSSWNPLEKWEEGLPIGNGRLGAMILGISDTDIIQINEDSIWSGRFQDRNNKNTLENLDNLKNLVRNGEISKAQKYILPIMGGTPTNMRVYQTMGNLTVSTSHDNVKDYKRELDLDKAIVTVNYEYKNIKYKREYFSSLNDDILIIRFTSDKKNSISFTSFLNRGIYANESGIEQNNIYIKSGSEGIEFASVMGVNCIDGNLLFAGDHLIVENASEVILYIDCQTSMRNKNFFEEAVKRVDFYKQYDFNLLKHNHIKAYQKQYFKLKFNLIDQTDKATDILLENYDENIEQLTQLYVNFSRYLIISSSQKKTNPINLQGIWCKDMDPPWGSKYTININAEMNYWPVDISNLSECYEPFFDLLKRMHKNGQRTAKVMYNCRGFVAHSNTNVYGDTAPQDYWMPATTWVLGAAWMSTHIFEHYEYTGNLEFLKEYYYILEDACLFFVDFMEKNKKGFYVCNPSLSPENSYKLSNGEIGTISYGSTMDSQILRLLMSQYKKASEILNLKTHYYAEIINIFENLPQTEIHNNGTIKEWLEEYEEYEPGHRHMSHLFGLFPGNEIKKDKNLLEAAKKTIDRRLKFGGAHTGWSRAWMMNFYTILKDSDKFLSNLLLLLKNSTLPNLLDNHPPFQIDGNMGALNSILMSYVQFYDNTIFLLPACPNELRRGKIKGIQLKEGIVIDIIFDNFEIDYIEIFSKNTKRISVNYNDEVINIILSKNKKILLKKENFKKSK